MRIQVQRANQTFKFLSQDSFEAAKQDTPGHLGDVFAAVGLACPLWSDPK